MSTITMIGIRLEFKGDTAHITRETYYRNVLGAGKIEKVETVPRDAVEQAVEEAWRAIPDNLLPHRHRKQTVRQLTIHELTADTIKAALTREEYANQNAKTKA